MICTLLHEFQSQICTKWSKNRANSVCTNLSMPAHDPNRKPNDLSLGHRLGTTDLDSQSTLNYIYIYEYNPHNRFYYILFYFICILMDMIWEFELFSSYFNLYCNLS